MFTGIYNKNDLRTYFKDLRKRLRENSKITEPVTIALNSPTHGISIIYHPTHDSCKIINSEEMPSHAKELQEQTFYGDLDINNSLTKCLLSKTKDTILRTRILTLKNELSEVKNTINLWKQDILPLHAMTPEKLRFKGDNDESWLSVASASNDKKTLRLLIRSGANINSINNDKGFTALHEACHEDNMKIVKLLLKSDLINVNIPSKENITPLMYAVGNGYDDIVRLLLKDKRTNINFTGKQGATALHVAAQNGHYAIAKNLLKAGADPSIETLGNCTPMDFAISHDHIDIANLLKRDEKIKQVIAKLSEKNVNSKRYLAIKNLYHSVLDANNDQEASTMISDFLQLEQIIKGSKFNSLHSSYDKIQNKAYQNYISGHSVIDISTQFKKSISMARNSIFNKNLSSAQIQNSFNHSSYSRKRKFHA